MDLSALALDNAGHMKVHQRQVDSYVVAKNLINELKLKFSESHGWASQPRRLYLEGIILQGIIC